MIIAGEVHAIDELTKQAFSDWENIFPDGIMAVAAIDRLIHHAPIIQTSGQRYRSQYAMNKNQKRRLTN